MRWYLSDAAVRLYAAVGAWIVLKFGHRWGSGPLPPPVAPAGPPTPPASTPATALPPAPSRARTTSIDSILDP